MDRFLLVSLAGILFIAIPASFWILICIPHRIGRIQWWAIFALTILMCFGLYAVTGAVFALTYDG